MTKNFRLHQSELQQGFSVLEALVAMAVLATAFLPLLTLQGQFLKTAQSLERTEVLLAAESMALAHIRAINLDQTSEGEIESVYGQISWTGHPAQGPTAGRDTAGFPSRFVFTLYDVDVKIKLNSGHIKQFSLQGLGWHPTKSVLDQF